MIDDGVRDDLIGRRAALEALKQMHGTTEGVGLLKIVGRGEGEMVDRDKVEYMLEELDPASIQPPVLEAAIRELEKRQGEFPLTGKIYGRRHLIDFGKYILRQPQDTWKGKDLGLKETPHVVTEELCES